VDRAYYENLRATLRTAVTGVVPVEPAMTALAGLVHAGGISELVFPGAENAPVRAKLAELAASDPAMTVPGGHSQTGTSDDPFRLATQAAVHSAVHSALHHSVHAAVSAATTSSHHHSGGSSSGDSPSHHHG
jgi:hypothetical protein